MTTSTVDIWQFLLIGELWDLALGVGDEPKVFPTGLSVSRQLEGRDDVYPRGVNMVAMLVFRKLEWEEMNLKFKVEVWALPLTHNTCLHSNAPP